jgi:hypothetical protein
MGRLSNRYQLPQVASDVEWSNPISTAQTKAPHDADAQPTPIIGRHLAGKVSAPINAAW